MSSKPATRMYLEARDQEYLELQERNKLRAQQKIKEMGTRWVGHLGYVHDHKKLPVLAGVR